MEPALRLSAPPERFAAALSQRYRLEREIGQGGMATVWLARDLRHDREVALKLLRPELTAILGTERFLNEIRITARLDHPHILTLIDSGADEGLLWYVVPFIRGESLRHRIQRERQLGIDEAVGITRQVASALEFAHRQGVIHRDIKPENILLHEGEAVLADFGIALALREAGGNRLTETGLSLGTPQYMSPEQATGDRALDARSDVYSLGAVLYEMLTGEPPHTGATVQAVIAKLMTERPTPVRTVRETVSPALEAAVTRALAKVPADRFPSAADFSRTLEAASRPTAEPSTSAVQLSRRVKPSRYLIAAAVLGLSVAIAAFLASRRGVVPPSRRPLAQPTRTQFTFTGDVTFPSISPDGQRVAYVRRECDSGGICSQSLIVQDVRGAGASTLLEGWPGIYPAEWSSDGRWLIVHGTGPVTGYGAHLLPSLGGTPRLVGPAATFLGGPDSLLVSPDPGRRTGIVPWLVVTTEDGVVRDTIPVKLEGAMMPATRVAPGGRFILGGKVGPLGMNELLLLDREGAVLDRWKGGNSRAQQAVWQGAAAVVMSLTGDGPRAPSILARIPVDPERGRFGGPPVPVAELDDDDDGGFSMSADGRTLAVSNAPESRRVVTLRVEPGSRRLRVERQVGAWTGRIAAQLAPSGDWVALLLPAPGGPGRDMIVLEPFAGGPRVTIVPTVDSLGGWQWAAERDVLYYLTPDGDALAVHEVDAATRRSAVVGTIPARAGSLEDFEVLHGGGFAWLVRGDPTVHYRLPGQAERQLEVPSSQIWFTSSAPGGFGVALIGWREPGGDSLEVHLADLAAGTSRPLWAALVEDGSAAWMPDGTLYAMITERQGTRAGYTIFTDGRPAVRHGLVPFARATYRLSADGTRGSALVVDTQTDAWLLTGWDPEARAP